MTQFKKGVFIFLSVIGYTLFHITIWKWVRIECSSFFLSLFTWENTLAQFLSTKQMLMYVLPNASNNEISTVFKLPFGFHFFVVNASLLIATFKLGWKDLRSFFIVNFIVHASETLLLLLGLVLFIQGDWIMGLYLNAFVLKYLEWPIVLGFIIFILIKMGWIGKQLK